MSKISAIVITFNEERNIERCLESLRWADELIVVDSFSIDRTVDLARKYTNNIIQHVYDGDIKQRERGFAVAKSDWLLYIDADEEVTPELQEEILHATNSSNAKDGYSLPRKVSIFGKWIYHGGWYPDYSFRLFRRDKYRAEHAEVHGGFTIDGEKGTLTSFLHHYTYETIDQYLAKMNDYTSLQISNKLKENARIGWTKIVLSPLSHFLRKYFSNKGYKDGVHGFILAVLGSIYTLALYTKLWEYQMRNKEGNGLMPPITNLELQANKRL